MPVLHVVNIVIIGDAAVGKTTLAVKKCKDTFELQMPTIILYVLLDVYLIFSDTNWTNMKTTSGDDVELRIWDTAGDFGASAWL